MAFPLSRSRPCPICKEPGAVQASARLACGCPPHAATVPPVRAETWDVARAGTDASVHLTWDCKAETIRVTRGGLSRAQQPLMPAPDLSSDSETPRVLQVLRDAGVLGCGLGVLLIVTLFR